MPVTSIFFPVCFKIALPKGKLNLDIFGQTQLFHLGIVSTKSISVSQEAGFLLPAFLCAVVVGSNFPVLLMTCRGKKYKAEVSSCHQAVAFDISSLQQHLLCL